MRKPKRCTWLDDGQCVKRGDLIKQGGNYYEFAQQRIGTRYSNMDVPYIRVRGVVNKAIAWLDSFGGYEGFGFLKVKLKL